jgi:hypothetical protein
MYLQLPQVSEAIQKNEPFRAFPSKFTASPAKALKALNLHGSDPSRARLNDASLGCAFAKEQPRLVIAGWPHLLPISARG